MLNQIRHVNRFIYGNVCILPEGHIYINCNALCVTKKIIEHVAGKL